MNMRLDYLVNPSKNDEEIEIQKKGTQIVDCIFEWKKAGKLFCGCEINDMTHKNEQGRL
jgi:hypothetical protein